MTRRPRKGSKPKVSAEDFSIPGFNEANVLHEYNHTLAQLRKMAKHYKLGVSGNKSVLIGRIHDHLSRSVHAVKIQCVFRGFIRRIYCRLKGPGYYDRSLCTNMCDFYSLDDLKAIPNRQFISFKDCDGFIYGFDVLSLYNLILKGGASTENPYNRKLIPGTVVTRIRFMIRLSIVLREPVNIKLDTDDGIATGRQRTEMRIISVFQDIDALGNYTDSAWFSSLSSAGLLRFIRELSDIWTYRAQLSPEMRCSIVPPNGDPFRGGQALMIPEPTHTSLQRISLSVVETMVRSGIDRDAKVLGAYYVLSALTLVSPGAAEAMPWLYDSVVQN